MLLLSRVDEAEDAAASVQKVVKALAVPLDVDGHRLHVTASIGLSMYPDDGQDADTLIRNADIAMYRAKERGRNVYQFYTPDMNVRVYSTVSEMSGSVFAFAQAAVSSGISEISASVVSSKDAIDEAFCSALRTTLAGSMTPALTRSS